MDLILRDENRCLDLAFRVSMIVFSTFFFFAQILCIILDSIKINGNDQNV